MKNFQWKKILPHIVAILVFFIVTLIYCKPALEGKVLQQSDITQALAMQKDSHNYEEKHGTLPLWTNGMFCGMPAYQITMSAYNPISIGYLQYLFTLNYAFKPFYFLFLACICFYFLSQVLKINPYLGIISALAYAYATYNPIIIAAGHDTKMMSIAYLPAFIASIILIYEKKYLFGAALTAIFTTLMGIGHFQINYYSFIIAAFMSMGYFVKWFKEKDFKRIFVSAGTVLGAGILGVMVTAVSILTTYEYSKLSIRGGSALANEKSNFTKTGLSNDYALSYSVYKAEPLVMMFPLLYGGSSGNLEVPEDKSKAIAALQEMPRQLAQQLQSFGALGFYWGGIDGVGTAGPPYAGAIICFLALLGFVILDGKHKWWILAACIVTLLMSWGKYFEGFNVFLLNHLPMYNKFRAPSMILVVPTFLLGLLAMLTVQKIIDTKNKSTLLQPLKKGLIITAGIFVVALLVYFAGDFTSQTDKMLLQQINNIPDAQQKQAILEPVKHFFAALKEDRQGLALSTIFRSFIFIAFVLAALWLYIKNKINTVVLLLAVGFLSFIDIIVIDNKYLNENNYLDAADYDNNFKPTEVDNAISKDTSFYRVFNLSHGLSSAFNADAMTAYFHKSIGGYHAAKLSLYQDLIERQLLKFPNCMPVINMLNTKYIILQNPQNGQLSYQINPANLGAVWFVKNVAYKQTPNDMMNALDNFNPKDTAFVYEKDKNLINVSNTVDTTASIKLINNDNDVVNYQSHSSANCFAVFSEVFYNKGWKAYIDGKETPIVQTNYVLRGLSVPAGEHEIKFEFKPASYYLGEKLSIIASAIIWLVLIAAVAQYFIRQKKLKTGNV